MGEGPYTIVRVPIVTSELHRLVDGLANLCRERDGLEVPVYIERASPGSDACNQFPQLPGFRPRQSPGNPRHAEQARQKPAEERPGVLNLQHPDPGFFGPDHIRRLQCVW